MRTKETKSIISQRDLNSEVLLNLFPRARPTGCAINIWNRARPTGICFQVLVYSFRSLYLIAATGVWKRKWEFKKAKATSSFCLTLRLDWQCDYKPFGMCSWAARPSCPDTWPLCSWAGVWLRASGKAQPGLVLSRRSMNNSQSILGGMLALTRSLSEQSQILPSSISQAREEHKYLTSPERM